ncbi:response regulator transcription factor [Aequorivita capsosiphonis]|uniref:response regulator transcription factor n=1 Tax=Aequorivita capsosiphonis TaxID=487317 RepID=UPI000425F623|nr:response regulator [Aequorivita capsosiphonis]
MKPKAHILIVEDKAILYKRLSMALSEENYSVDGFTPSVEKALERFQTKLPDIVLLDIDLEGALSGIDLGKILSTSYNIPFIYVTDYDDNETFFEGLQTHHENFLVKTKPHLDTKQVVRAIQTALSRNKKQTPTHCKDAILCFTNYITNVKNHGNQTVSELPVLFVDIAMITTKSTQPNLEKSKRTGKPEFLKLKSNYVRIATFNEKSYYLPVSLSEILGKLPNHFIRINESEIVNISEHILDGRINGIRLKIGDHICHISKTYKPEVEKRFELLYQKFK